MLYLARCSDVTSFQDCDQTKNKINSQIVAHDTTYHQGHSKASIFPELLLFVREGGTTVAVQGPQGRVWGEPPSFATAARPLGHTTELESWLREVSSEEVKGFLQRLCTHCDIRFSK